MIDIDFVNLIFIIADNVSGSGELGNPYSSASGALGSPRPSASVVSNSPHSSAPIESSKPNNSMADFLANVLANPFGDFGIDTSFDLVVDPVLSPTVPSISDLPALGRFLQDDISALAADALSALSWNVPLDHYSSAGCPFLPLLLTGDFTTSQYHEHISSAGRLLLPPLPPLGNSTTLSALGRDLLFDYPLSPGPFPPLSSLGNSTYNR